MSFPVFLLCWLLFLAAALVLFAVFLGRRVESTLRPQGQWLEVGGERIHYRELGAGPAIVLLHGLGGNMRNFDYLPLRELAREHRLILVDRPGSGHSPRRDDTRAGIDAQARLVAGFIRALGLPQPPLLVGHSLGGAIALGVALHDPQGIAGLALLAPLTQLVPATPDALKGLAIRRPWLRRLFAYTLALPAAIAGSRKVLAFVFAPEPPPRDFALRGGGLLGLRPRAFYAASSDLCAVEHDLPAQQQRYAELRLPVHILYGDGDLMLDWQLHGQGLADKLPQARLVVLPGVGHMVPVTQPAQTAQLLRDAAAAAFGRQ
ncbi:MAG: alpha/beta hydrolase [Ramlibacter sp.]|jgi:pimeloyl-ACP methyl ester carboxylesterase|uniref:alpha/beta fold hydrolase n=1 Tax=Ramlibacter sp. TaxID=1917967 RepID=UPI002637D91B|nr:alpha/beta hydrolase [Ramlibacter sp.]MDB5750936.1 alpha/beta hydrolase [Ramlibacter sp.]